MTNLEFVEKLKLALSLPSTYAFGAFGAPVEFDNNRERYQENCINRGLPKQAVNVRNAPDGTFLFDCVGLGKSILWGWNADRNKRYGGAMYQSNNVPDFGANSIYKYCPEMSTDFSNPDNIPIGAWLWKPGHCGYHIGGGQVIECTVAWNSKVQQTDFNKRKWEKWGCIQFLTYERKKEYIALCKTANPELLNIPGVTVLYCE